MAAIITKKLKGSTLIEVTVAAVIIVIIFLLASGLAANLWKSGPTDRKIAAHTLLNKLANDYKGNTDFTALKNLPKGLKLEKKSEVYGDYQDLQQITLTLREIESDHVLDEIVFLYPTNEKQ